MRTTIFATLMTLTACGGTPLDQPQPAHQPESDQAGELQCESQALGGVPLSLPDGDVFYPAEWPDGAVVLDFLDPSQCAAYCALAEAGPGCVGQ